MIDQNYIGHSEYGYEDVGTVGLRQWYADYMNCKILDNKTNKYVGLNSDVYTLKPVHESNFAYPLELEFNHEPENIIEEIREILKTIKNNI